MRKHLSIRILDYGVGNLHSVFRACKIYANDVLVVKEISKTDSASHLVLPGVGAFGVAMKSIKENGLSEQIKMFIDSGKPLLGICVGMQILCEVGHENGIHRGLGILDGAAMHLSDCSLSTEIQVPNMGWSKVMRSEKIEDSVLFRGLPSSFYAYFAHTYAVQMKSANYVASYIEIAAKRITATVEKDNVYGVQFHPEKSGLTGLRIIENFIEISSQ
jgi:glutamine amidotransferase